MGSKMLYGFIVSKREVTIDQRQPIAYTTPNEDHPPPITMDASENECDPSRGPKINGLRAAENWIFLNHFSFITADQLPR